MKKNRKFLVVFIINLVIFITINLLFNIKYEQVDDFIIYSLYSGLDGTFNLHAIYIHPVICIIIGLLFRILSFINWHSIYLLSMQFVCFTLIGYTFLKKHNSNTSIVLYALFASVFYTTFMMLVQYTSVAALLIFTAFFLLINSLEMREDKKRKQIITEYSTIFILYTLGIMTRIQSLLIVLPFFIFYFIMYLFKFIKNSNDKQEFLKLLKCYLIIGAITIIIYLSNFFIYNSNPVYKKYNEWNKARTMIQDMMKISYTEDNEIYEKVGWTKNDLFLFNTFGFGDENIFSKDSIIIINDLKGNKDGNSWVNKNFPIIIYKTFTSLYKSYTFIFIIFMAMYVLNLLKNNKRIENTLIFLLTIFINMIFIALNRSMLRVVIPEYLIGTALLIYNLNIKNKKTSENELLIYLIAFFSALFICYNSGAMYQLGYKLNNYTQYKELINFTNNNKDNVYLYTIPSLQHRYLAYSVYTMPPKGSFSNLRQMGGWDMYTENYYDFKDRNGLDGTFLDLLKDNVYLIDGEVIWSGTKYDDYKGKIAVAIKEHYNIDVEFVEVEQFNNLKIYKTVLVEE